MLLRNLMHCLLLTGTCTLLAMTVISCPSQHLVSTFINRGHTVRAVCESFQLSKDAGFKVIAHMMPDLPNVGLDRDIQQFIVCNISLFIIIFSMRE